MIALDVETIWNKNYSVATMGLDRYAKHPDFRVTIVSLVADDGFEWVGDPRDLPADILNGQSICAHNAEFDSVCCRMAMAGSDATVYSKGMGMYGGHGILLPAPEVIGGCI